jgi:hypothetical protein
MALPARIEKTSPADSDNPSAGAAQIRNLKGFLEDLFGVLDTQTYTAKAMDIGVGGQITVGQQRLLFQNGNATTPSFGFAGATGTGLAYDGATTAIAILRNGSKVGHLGIPQQPDMGGTGLDSSAWTGVVRVDAGVWSAADVLNLPGVTDRLVTIGDDAGLSNNNVDHSLMTIGRDLDSAGGGESTLGVFGVTTTGIGGDKTTLYVEGWNSKAAGIAGNITALNANGVKSGASYTSGTTYAAYAYALHTGALPDGGLIGLGADIGNYGTVEGPGGDANYKMNLALGSGGTNLADFAIYTTSATQGWVTGYYQTKVSYQYINLVGPLGYPVGTPATTTGIWMENSANWASAIRIPNNVWIHGNHSAGSTKTPLIKASADDVTISLGVTKTAVVNAALFSATKYVLIKDINGASCYVPCADASW